ncbi:hypothetical protein [Serpentinicella alkaliphila]|uniref:hypothetical protein n=1 Tax=Serpentinicella alkaliphila TaxID=1734049 RepID=UPI00201A3159|nr:hypothetical protein [Serpentinicella alkaliphila]
MLPKLNTIVCILDSDGVIHTNSLRISNSKEGFDTLYSSILSALTPRVLTT